MATNLADRCNGQSCFSYGLMSRMKDLDKLGIKAGDNMETGPKKIDQKQNKEVEKCVTTH
jgi:hypothetical protein